MKPVNFKEANCQSTSSNCVQYDGPEITFGDITICRGDTITKLTYLMALEVAKLRDLTDIANYPVQCLGDVVTVTDFKSLLNALISKACA